MLRNEKLFPTLSSLYLHDNQSSHLIPHAEESLPSVLHPEIIDKPYPPSNQKKRKNREHLSSEKRKKESSIQKPSSPRKSPPRVLEEQPDQTLQAWPTSRPSFRWYSCSWATCSTHVEQKYRRGSEGERETEARASGTIIAAALERGTERSWSFS